MNKNGSRKAQEEHSSSSHINTSKTRTMLKRKTETELSGTKKRSRREDSWPPADLTQIIPTSGSRLTQDITAPVSTKKMSIIEKLKSTAPQDLLPHDPHSASISYDEYDNPFPAENLRRIEFLITEAFRKAEIDLIFFHRKVSSDDAIEDALTLNEAARLIQHLDPAVCDVNIKYTMDLLNYLYRIASQKLDWDDGYSGLSEEGWIVFFKKWNGDVNIFEELRGFAIGDMVVFGGDHGEYALSEAEELKIIENVLWWLNDMK